MRVAIHAEGPDDEVVLQEIARHFIQLEVNFVELGRFRARGREQVFSLLRKRLMLLAESQAADLLIVAVDSDLDLLHAEGSLCEAEKCPLCRLQETVDLFRASPLPHWKIPDVAIAVAVPAIEAWLLLGRPPNFSEASWRALGAKRSDSHKRKLKDELHGLSRDEAKRHRILLEETKRVLVLRELEEHFPVGLAPMISKLRLL